MVENISSSNKVKVQVYCFDVHEKLETFDFNNLRYNNIVSNAVTSLGSLNKAWPQAYWYIFRECIFFLSVYGQAQDAPCWIPVLNVVVVGARDSETLLSPFSFIACITFQSGLSIIISAFSILYIIIQVLFYVIVTFKLGLPIYIRAFYRLYVIIYVLVYS